MANNHGQQPIALNRHQLRKVRIARIPIPKTIPIPTLPTHSARSKKRFTKRRYILTNCANQVPAGRRIDSTEIPMQLQ